MLSKLNVNVRWNDQNIWITHFSVLLITCISVSSPLNPWAETHLSFPLWVFLVPASAHMVYATYVAGVLLGSPIALVDGTVGSEGRTALRKATGFWIRPVGEIGAGVTLCGWTCFALAVESVNGSTMDSLGLGRNCSLLLVNPPEDLDWAGGGFPVKFSLLFVLWVPWETLLNVVTEELELELVVGGVVCDGRNCLGRV